MSGNSAPRDFIARLCRHFISEEPGVPSFFEQSLTEACIKVKSILKKMILLEGKGSKRDKHILFVFHRETISA